MLETAYTSLLSKITPLDASLTVKSSINEIKNNAMKIRYVSVLKGNLNVEHAKQGFKDEGSIQYSTIQDFGTNQITRENAKEDNLQYCTNFKTQTTDKDTDANMDKAPTTNLHWKQSLDFITVGSSLQYLLPAQKDDKFYTLPKTCHRKLRRSLSYI